MGHLAFPLVTTLILCFAQLLQKTRFCVVCFPFTLINKYIYNYCEYWTHQSLSMYFSVKVMGGAPVQLMKNFHYNVVCEFSVYLENDCTLYRL